MHIYAYIQTYSASFMPYCKYNTCCCCFCYFFNYLCKHSSTIVFALTPAQSDYHNHAHQQFISASAAANNAAAAAAATCHCQLPGFGTNLHTKSTQDAKFKIVLAITLCCVFMVSKSITKQANHEARTHIHMRAQQQHCTSTVCVCVYAYVLCKKCLAHPASAVLRWHVPAQRQAQHLFSPLCWRRAWRMSNARRLMRRVKFPQPVGRWLALN